MKLCRLDLRWYGRCPGMAYCKCGQHCSGCLEVGYFFGQLSEREVEEKVAP